jgi:hypothetical protein
MLKPTEREILAKRCYDYYQEMNSLPSNRGMHLKWEDENLSFAVKDSWIGVVTLIEIAIQDKKCNFPVETLKS